MQGRQPQGDLRRLRPREHGDGPRGLPRLPGGTSDAQLAVKTAGREDTKLVRMLNRQAEMLQMWSNSVKFGAEENPGHDAARDEPAQMGSTATTCVNST